MDHKIETPEKSGMQVEQIHHQGKAALLCNARRIATPVNNSLCCAAAGITTLCCSTSEALTPQEKLREAVNPDAKLITQERPPAQPVVGFKPSPNSDERTEYEKELPIPEGLQKCANRNTYIRTTGSSPSNTFTRKHYADRAKFTAKLWRARKRPILDSLRLSHISLAMNTRQERS
ncbi:MULTISPECIES: hypothetical protein [unclassified Pseudomonas]|uniref:hypothetical protein n=1 Tax=unclassified Pseudomonas TaxID=196821 RepID=UPI000930EB42|nr:MULTISPECIES: hypothetical protein [unclassified Pseudomonas]